MPGTLPASAPGNDRLSGQVAAIDVRATRELRVCSDVLLRGAERRRRFTAVPGTTGTRLKCQRQAPNVRCVCRSPPTTKSPINSPSGFWEWLGDARHSFDECRRVTAARPHDDHRAHPRGAATTRPLGARRPVTTRSPASSFGSDRLEGGADGDHLRSRPLGETTAAVHWWSDCAIGSGTGEPCLKSGDTTCSTGLIEDLKVLAIDS